MKLKRIQNATGKFQIYSIESKILQILTKLDEFMFYNCKKFLCTVLNVGRLFQLERNSSSSYSYHLSFDKHSCRTC
jgi:hypothetical protein